MSVDAKVYYRVKLTNEVICFNCAVELATKGEEVEAEANNDTYRSPCNCHLCNRYFN